MLVTTHKFDAVLLDYEMPLMNGCDVAVEIERITPELAVILKYPPMRWSWSMLLYPSLKRAERCYARLQRFVTGFFIQNRSRKACRHSRP